jgi:hypothetical protein
MYEHVSERFGVRLLERLGHVIVPAAMRANRRDHVLSRVSATRRASHCDFGRDGG